MRLKTIMEAKRSRSLIVIWEIVIIYLSMCVYVHVYICIDAHIHTHMVLVPVFRQQPENHRTEHTIQNMRKS